jgi:uncharacterized SAM-binding protein YcdF (DUF218 family)
MLVVNREQTPSRPLPRPGHHKILRLLGLALLVLGLWVAGDLLFVLTGAEVDHAAPADVIIVLGCQPWTSTGISPCIRARADHAADLYRQGLARHVIPTGWTSSRGTSEAVALTLVLLAEGVPRSAIVPDDQAQNTIQNIHNSQAIMAAHGWHTAILVTEPYHINRAALIARDAGLTAFPSPAPDGPDWRDPWSRAFHVERDTLSLMLYQVKQALGIHD